MVQKKSGYLRENSDDDHKFKEHSIKIECIFQQLIL